jgi:hypothetical protein
LATTLPATVAPGGSSRVPPHWQSHPADACRVAECENGTHEGNVVGSEVHRGDDHFVPGQDRANILAKVFVCMALFVEIPELGVVDGGSRWHLPHTA